MSASDVHQVVSKRPSKCVVGVAYFERSLMVRVFPSRLSAWGSERQDTLIWTSTEDRETSMLATRPPLLSTMRFVTKMSGCECPFSEKRCIWPHGVCEWARAGWSVLRHSDWHAWAWLCARVGRNMVADI